ncbi:hypothetical protein [Agrobacterium vitis]|uniref:hypothetical protein n=1 Tax=Agrobacterium vitis TaxID=373 RepID=UPI001F19FC15|nr:hypothetical protein [Agrobacterium vitis]
MDRDIAITHDKSDLLTAAIGMETAFPRVKTSIIHAKPAADDHQRHSSSVIQDWTVVDVSLFGGQQTLCAAQSAAITFIEIKRDIVRYWVAPRTSSEGGFSAPAGAPTSAKGIY